MVSWRRLTHSRLSNFWMDAQEETMAKDPSEPTTETIAETDNYLAWTAEEPDGETTYNLELNNVTLHFFQEEWDEFLQLMRALIKK